MYRDEWTKAKGKVKVNEYIKSKKESESDTDPTNHHRPLLLHFHLKSRSQFAVKIEMSDLCVMWLTALICQVMTIK